MVTREAILEVLRTIDDPEMPISIVDLGIVEDVRVQQVGRTARVVIDVLPTFIGCPALPVLEREITEQVSRLDGTDSVAVRFVYDPPWTVDRISEPGRASLKAIGVTVPGPAADEGLVQVGRPVNCPFCDAPDTHQTSAFGPTRCRAIYYCQACKNSFEHMKRV